MDLQNEETKIALSDLWRILKQSAFKIFSFSVIALTLFGLYLFSKPPVYTAEAQFLEKNELSSNSGSLKDMFFSSKGSSNAQSIMLSKVILEPVIEKLQLQAVIKSKNKNSFQNSSDNLKILYSQLFGQDKSQLLLEDLVTPLYTENLQFSGEFPLSLELEFTDKDEYKIIHPEKGFIKNAKLGQMQDLGFVKFCLKSDEKLQKQRFSISFTPMEKVLKSLKSKLSIKSSAEAANILDIKYSNRDRHLASRLVNMVMEHYQIHLKKDNERRTGEQLKYLHSRQQQGQDEIEKVMQAHGQYLAENLGAGGFKDIDAEAEFLALNQSNWNTKIWDLKLELQLLDNAQEKPETLFKLDTLQLGNGKDLSNINELITRIRDLNSQKNQIKALLEEKHNLLSPEERDRLENRLLIAKENLKLYIESHKKSVQEQITAFESQIQALNNKVSSLPQKWIIEQKLEMQCKINEKMMDKVTELVENTILSHNLESIESRPLEIAKTPIDPEMPNFFLLISATFLLSSFSGSLFFLSLAYSRGIAASVENLRLEGFAVSGILSLQNRAQNLCDYDPQDLQTLRNIASLLDKKTKTALLAYQKGKSYAREVKKLLELSGERVAIIEIPNVAEETKIEENSLLDYLKNHDKKLSLQDLLPAGGSSPYIAEFLLSKRFKKICEELENCYDKVLFEIEAQANSAEIFNLSKYCDLLVLYIDDERLNELSFLKNLSIKKKKELSFIF